MVRIRGEVEVPSNLSLEDLKILPRIAEVADLHCVTAWSKLGLAWSGYRFSDLYHMLIVPRARPRPGVSFVLFKGLDGYRASLPINDA
jgi:DMSO/TMAO reductase YedYZ molybdopterin-dependent catalytic subunit